MDCWGISGVSHGGGLSSKMDLRRMVLMKVLTQISYEWIIRSIFSFGPLDTLWSFWCALWGEAWFHPYDCDGLTWSNQCGYFTWRSYYSCIYWYKWLGVSEKIHMKSHDSSGSIGNWWIGSEFWIWKCFFEGLVLLLPREIHETEVFLRWGLAGALVGFTLHA